MAGLPHGKHPDHLGVLLDANPVNPLPAGAVVATFLPVMTVANPPTYNGWGVLLHTDRHTTLGLHLFPDGAVWAEATLREMARLNPTLGIGLEHMLDHQLHVWREFTADAATALADGIKAAMGMAP